MKRPEFSKSELLMLTQLPGALEALADYHSYQETCADASDFMECAEFHGKRSIELLNIAAYIRISWEDGNEPKFDGEQHDC